MEPRKSSHNAQNDEVIFAPLSGLDPRGPALNLIESPQSGRNLFIWEFIDTIQADRFLKLLIRDGYKRYEGEAKDYDPRIHLGQIRISSMGIVCQEYPADLFSRIMRGHHLTWNNVLFSKNNQNNPTSILLPIDKLCTNFLAQPKIFDASNDAVSIPHSILNHLLPSRLAEEKQSKTGLCITKEFFADALSTLTAIQRAPTYTVSVPLREDRDKLDKLINELFSKLILKQVQGVILGIPGHTPQTAPSTLNVSRVSASSTLWNKESSNSSSSLPSESVTKFFDTKGLESHLSDRFQVSTKNCRLMFVPAEKGMFELTVYSSKLISESKNAMNDESYASNSLLRIIKEEFALSQAILGNNGTYFLKITQEEANKMRSVFEPTSSSSSPKI